MKYMLSILAFAALSITAVAQKPAGSFVYRHVVMFSFKAASSAADIENVTKGFAGLYGKVPQIKAIEWGINNSPENLNQGLTHCFILSFSSEKDLADYQLNPTHLEFQKLLKQHMDKVFVVDYWVK